MKDIQVTFEKKVPIYHLSLSYVWSECPTCKSNLAYTENYISNCPYCGQPFLWDWDEIDKKAKKSKEWIILNDCN